MHKAVPNSVCIIGNMELEIPTQSELKWGLKSGMVRNITRLLSGFAAGLDSKITVTLTEMAVELRRILIHVAVTTLT